MKDSQRKGNLHVYRRIRKGTWFNASHLSIHDILHLAVCRSMNRCGGKIHVLSRDLYDHVIMVMNESAANGNPQ